MPAFILSKMNEKLKKLIESYLSEEQILMEFSTDVSAGFLRVVVDSKTTITLQDTAALISKLKESEWLDKMFKNGLRLEVTTPGIGTPLKYPFQFRKNINREITLAYDNGSEKESIKGKITNATDVLVEVNTNEKKQVLIPYDQVVDAKVNISFK